MSYMKMKAIERMNALTAENKARWIARLRAYHDIGDYVAEIRNGKNGKERLIAMLECGFSDEDWEHLRDWLGEGGQSQEEINKEEGQWLDKQK